MALLGTTAVLALAGCGSSGTSTSSATAPPSAQGAPNVKAQLLALSDLPAGWSVDNRGVSNSGSTPSCLKDATSFGQGAKVHDSADYQDGANGLPSLSEGINYSPGKAAQALASTESTLGGCGKISLSSGGHTFSGSVGELSFSPIADSSKAYQIALSTSYQGLDISAGIDIVVFRKGADVVGLIYTDVGTPDISQVQQLATAAAAKIPAST